MSGPISQFIERHYRHFNAATLVEAAEAYNAQLAQGGKMFVTLAGAMSTAEIGRSLAEMIRQDKVHIITCTGANLEEDVFNLVAHDHYKRVPGYRDLSPEDEHQLFEQHYNRVTDTCIPEEEAMRRIERAVSDVWKRAEETGNRYFPHQYLYELLASEGYRVGASSGGWAVLNDLAVQKPRVLVTDIRMPEMDGLELLERVKAASPGTRVILTTAYGDKDTRVKSFAKGCDGFITKPFKNAEFLEMVRKLVEEVPS